jgi:hypothetical protein
MDRTTGADATGIAQIGSRDVAISCQAVHNTREDDITRVFCGALRRNRSVRELPFYVQLQMVELDDSVGQELGRMDIAFLPTSVSGSPNESIYFCLECKRLNVIINGKRRPGGSDYVVHGMMRFVTAQYANTVRHGGMLGYVIDGRYPRRSKTYKRTLGEGINY